MLKRQYEIYAERGRGPTVVQERDSAIRVRPKSYTDVDEVDADFGSDEKEDFAEVPLRRGRGVRFDVEKRVERGNTVNARASGAEVSQAVSKDDLNKVQKSVDGIIEGVRKLEIFLEKAVSEGRVANPTDERREPQRRTYTGTFCCWNCGGNHRKDVCDKEIIGDGFTFRPPRYFDRMTNNANPNRAPIEDRRDFQ